MQSETQKRLKRESTETQKLKRDSETQKRLRVSKETQRLKGGSRNQKGYILINFNIFPFILHILISIIHSYRLRKLR